MKRMAALWGVMFIVSAVSAHAVTVDDRKWKSTAQVDVRDAAHASTDNFTPQVAVDHSGNITVVWELSDGTIWSRRFRATDKQWEAPLKVTDVGTSPQVAMDGSGNAFAVWEQSGGVRASRYSNGSWGEIKPLQAVSGTGSTPQIVADANGNALAVWAQSGGHVWANRYTKNADSWGTAEQLEFNAGTASSPQIAIDANGNALAVWTQAQAIWANYFTTSGTPHWVGAKVAETNTANASAPQVAMDGLGNGRAIWTETDSGTDHVWSSRYTASSNQWDQVRAIESNAGNASAPQVAADAMGNAVAVWFQFNSSCNCHNVFSSRYVTSTSQWEGALLLQSDNTHDAVSPSIAIDANGNALAVWQQRQLDASLYGIFAARYTPSGTLQASWTRAVLIEHDDTGDASLPRVVFDANGNAMAAWYQFDGRSEVQHFSIRANRYGVPQWSAPAPISSDNALTPRIAFDSSGDALAVWWSNTTSHQGIGANRYASGGGWEAPKVVEAISAGYSGPYLAFLAPGTALVAWGESNGATSSRYTLGSGWGPVSPLFGTRVSQLVACGSGRARATWLTNSVGTLWSSGYANGTWDSGKQLGSALEMGGATVCDANGDVLTLWGAGVWGPSVILWSRYTPSGGWQPMAQLPIAPITAVTSLPSLAGDAAGNAIAVWTDGAWHVQASSYAAGGNWAPPVQLDSGTATRGAPQIVMDAKGNALAIWSQVSGSVVQVWSAHFTAGGNWEAPTQISPSGVTGLFFTSQYRVAFGPQGDAFAIAALSDGTSVRMWASHYVAGAGWAAPVQIGDALNGTFPYPDIAVDGDGNAIAVWSRWNGTTKYDIVAPRAE